MSWSTSGSPPKDLGNLLLHHHLLLRRCGDRTKRQRRSLTVEILQLLVSELPSERFRSCCGSRRVGRPVRGRCGASVVPSRRTLAGARHHLAGYHLDGLQSLLLALEARILLGELMDPNL